MRWIARFTFALLALGACSDTPDGSVGLVLDIPNEALDPSGYTTVEITLHEANGDSSRTAVIETEGRFDLGAISPRDDVWIEATLRNDSGAAVGYGRTAESADFAAGEEIVIPVRRPIAYFAGYSRLSSSSNWFGQPATFSDLSSGASLDGSTQVGARPALVVAAGPRLFSLDQAPEPMTGVPTGPTTIAEVSTGSHAARPAEPAFDDGAVQDGAGTDDGQVLVIGTSTKLIVMSGISGTPARPGEPLALAPTVVAEGNFSRVAVLAVGENQHAAIAIAKRGDTGATPCPTTAELWYVPDLTQPDAEMIMVGGFTDVAADSGHAYFIDACANTLGEVIDGDVRELRGDLASMGRATALAVTNGQAFIGVEGTAGTTARTSLLVTPVESTSSPRTLWSEASAQVLAAVNYPGVERRLDATSAKFQQLELGAGGDYVAATIASSFFGVDVNAANFPQMTVVTEELRVFDAATGGTLQRYRAWCEGTFIPDPLDIDAWQCSITSGQTAPANLDNEHRVQSMTFLFGKK